MMMRNLTNKLISFFKTHPNVSIAIISALAAFLTSLFANQVSSILYPYAPSYEYVNDQNMFYYMGQLFVKGYKPYEDFFDHKGPYVFYYTGLGVLLGGKIGMLLVQTVTFAFFYYFLIKSLILLNIRKSLVFAAISLVFAVVIFGAQSPSDFEIDFAFIAASLYFYLKAIKSEDDKYFIYGNIFTGLCAGISIHLRATDAMVSLAMVIYFGVRQIIKKRYKNIFINSLVCIGMIVLASLPPLIHSISGGFTAKMYDACILDNFRYVSTSNGGFSLFKLASRGVVGLLTIGSGVVIFFLTKKKLISFDETLFYSLTIDITMLIQFVIAYYIHYLMIALPLLVIFAAYAFNFVKINKVINYIIVGVMGVVSLAACLVFPITLYSGQMQKDEAITAYVSSTIAMEDRNQKTLCYNLSSSVYINNGIDVGYGDFCVQSTHMYLSKDFSLEALKGYVSSDNCRYLITNNNDYRDEFIDWLDNESALTLISSSMEGAKYIKIYTK